MTQDKVRIGKIVGFHGVRGDVKVRPTSEDADWPETVSTVWLKNPKTSEEFQVKPAEIRRHGPLLLIRFAEYPDRTAAEALEGMVLYASRNELPAPAEGEYWADDLIGLTVVDVQTGRKRGVIKDLLVSGGSDFLEIQLEDSTETVVIPFIEQFFPTVDLENGTVTVDLLSDFFSTAREPVTPDRLKQ